MIIYITLVKNNNVGGKNIELVLEKRALKYRKARNYLNGIFT